MNKHLKLASITLILGISPSLSHALSTVSKTQSLDSIRSTALHFIESELDSANNLSKDTNISINSMDTRLRLNQCETELEAFWPASSKKSGRITVGVRCPGKKPWSIYVPARIDIYKHVLVANRILPRNTTLTKSDLKLSKVNITDIRQDYISSKNQLIGYRTKRHLKVGDILSSNSIAAPMLIKRGEKVTIMAESKGMQVIMSGTAMHNGTKGETVKVRNTSSNRVIEGTVIAKSKIKVVL